MQCNIEVAIAFVFQNLIASHQTFKDTLPDAQKEKDSMLALINNIKKIQRQYNLPEDGANPYTTVTGEVELYLYDSLLW